MSDKRQEGQVAGNLTRRDFLKGTAIGAAGIIAGSMLPSKAAASDKAKSHIPEKWDYEADIVIIGAGATGLPAALRALDAGASVIIVEQNYDVGGRAIISGGATPLGGGTRVQKLHGVEDSPEKYFRDMTDWSVLTKNGLPEYRYNNFALMRASANVQPKVFDYLEANGVRFRDDALLMLAGRGGGWGVSVPRNNMPDDDLWDKDVNYSPALAQGAALIRPLERAARKKGAKFLMNRHADRLIREGQFSGRVLGVEASYTPRILPGTNKRLESYYSEGNIDDTRQKVFIRAKKAVILATSGFQGNKWSPEDVRSPELRCDDRFQPAL
jgi:predicted oxidoreductase